MFSLSRPAVTVVVLGLAASTAVADARFNVLQHLGGNGQWFPGPEVTGISSNVPDGCTVDLVASFSRHGSRYPDQGAYNEWTNLYSRIQKAGDLKIKDSALNFLSSWKPVLSDPAAQIAQVSTTGYKELYDMGSTYRLRYSHLYDYNTNFMMWANYYKSSPRVRDSARMFARGFLGPNATELGTIYALNASDPRSFLNSLAISDLCPAYADNSSPQSDPWNNIYLPPIQRRLNEKIKGGFNFTQSDVSIVPYLCGFESQINGRRSPWCNVFTEAEILQYEYAQDLRYWYGTGLGTDIEKYLMLPVLNGLVKRFIDGPDATYKNTDGTSFKPPKVMASFSNDGQINQLVAALGVYDNQKPLPTNRVPADRLFHASNYICMRGTASFERMTCSMPSSPRPGYGQQARNETFIRVLLNDAVYPVVGCTSGPGKSCPLMQYQQIVQKKLKEAGNFSKLCNSTIQSDRDSVSFFTTTDLPFTTIVKP